MRQGQQNRRGRGRSNNNNNNNNRKSQNPLTRSYESAGPDVKLRGTPSHIAEKYVSLARDALSSGDPVLAENYLQHAEHYNRIILTYREQQISQGGDPYHSGMARTHSLSTPDNEGDDFGEDDGDDNAAQGQPGPSGGDAPPSNFQPPQQRYDNNRPRHDNQHRGDNRQHYNQNNRHDRQDRYGGGDQQRGSYRDDRGGNQQPQHGGDQSSHDGGYRRRDRFGNSNYGQGGNGGQPANGSERPHAQPQFVSPVAQPTAPQPNIAAPASGDQEQPAFLRRPVRRPKREEGEAAAEPRQPATEQQD